MPTASTPRSPGHLRAALRHGRFQPGSRLPSERDLAALLQVSRATVNLELAELERDGLIQRVSDRIRMVSGRDDGAPTTAPSVTGIAVLTDQLPDEDRQRIFVNEQLAYATMRRLVALGENLSLTPVQAQTDWAGLLRQTPRAWMLLDQVVEFLPDGQRQELLAGCVARGTPTVLFADCLPAAEVAGCPADLVFSAQADGQAQLVRHLHAAGARRIVLLTRDRPVPQHWEVERQRGYAEACAALGLARRPAVPMASGAFDGDPERVFRARVRLLAGHLLESVNADGPFDAICCLSDGEVALAAAACRLLGIDVAGRITGFDHYWHPGLPEAAWETTPPLATIDRAPTAAADAMLAAVRRRQAQPAAAPQRTTVPCRLVARDHLTQEKP